MEKSITFRYLAAYSRIQPYLLSLSLSFSPFHSLVPLLRALLLYISTVAPVGTPRESMFTSRRNHRSWRAKKDFSFFCSLPRVFSLFIYCDFKRRRKLETFFFERGTLSSIRSPRREMYRKSLPLSLFSWREELAKRRPVDKTILIPFDRSLCVHRRRVWWFTCLARGPLFHWNLVDDDICARRPPGLLLMNFLVVSLCPDRADERAGRIGIADGPAVDVADR